MQHRLATAPISWGVCEVPGWGVMLPPDRVLSEMASLGLSATELGAAGYLPADGRDLTATLRRHELSLVGGFVPLVLHDPDRLGDALRRAEAVAGVLSACGATEFVTAAVQDYDWPRPAPLDRDGMCRLGEGLRAVGDLCARHGLTQVLHPHVDTLIETAADVELALECTSTLWCLDTGHLSIGGLDPAVFAKTHPDRVGHVHLKDVDQGIARHVLKRDMSLLQGVQAGVFRPLGQGDVAIDEVVLSLESAGYSGWYVLEQDTAILGAVPEPGEGPIREVDKSLSFLERHVISQLPEAV